MKIAFVPIDDRPVCYTLVQQIAAIDKSIELLLPPREWLGNLKRAADTEKILIWLSELGEVDACVIALDTIAYGGLIPSRRSEETFEQIKVRLERLREVLPPNTHAFSSIMRISNNNINEEEKEYWNVWGKKIFDYSFNRGEHDIPAEILDDYLATRRRNFGVNKLYLDWDFETLVFSKDDCAPKGFNVDEARELERLGGFVKTGADEMPLALLTRALSPQLKIKPVFLEPKYKHLISNYEDISIEASVRGQIELAGCQVVESGEDLTLYVNNFADHQGEIVMGIDTQPFGGRWEQPDSPYAIADVRFANGADNAFVEQLLAHFAPLVKGGCANSAGGFDNHFYGYAGWNTSANTLGSVICAAGVKMRSLCSSCLSQADTSERLPAAGVKFRAKQYNDEAFKRLQIVRLLDDWAYQANVRQNNGVMEDFAQRLGVNAQYSYPWDRNFEIEIHLQ